jgi:hypothetical protein
MTLKEKVFEFIQKRGPQTNVELVAKFKIKKASMRRTCGELVHEGKLVPIKTANGCSYGLSSDTRAAVIQASAAAPEKAGPKMPAPTPHKKRTDEEKPADPQDWRMTDFCF